MGAGNSGLFHETKGATKNDGMSIDSNVIAVKQKYPIVNGYFGEKGKNCRVIKSNNQYQTANDFYSLIAKGGVDVQIIPKGQGKITKLFDGTLIVYRIFTKTTNSPAVEIKIINSTCLKSQKIHFIKE